MKIGDFLNFIPYIGPIFSVCEAREVDRKMQAIFRELRHETAAGKEEISSLKEKLISLYAQTLVSSGITVTLLIGMAVADIFPFLAILACVGYVYAGSTVGNIEARLTASAYSGLK